MKNKKRKLKHYRFMVVRERTKTYRLLSILAVTVFIYPLVPYMLPLQGQYVEVVEAATQPLIAEKKGRDIGLRSITMYTSTPEQTDASPCIGANGQDVCVLWKRGQNLCATNDFPFNTVLTIEPLGDCLVVDRMNSRYQTEIDWYAGYDNDCLDGVQVDDYCPTYWQAKGFGRKDLQVKTY